MRVLIDTNVLLDVLANRPGLVDASKKIWQMCEVSAMEGFVCSLSIVNISNILRKTLTPESVREIIEKMDLIFSLKDLKPADLKKATKLSFSDYEDAVQAACAQRIKAQYIVTRNIKDFRNSPIPAMKPEEVIERYAIDGL